MSQKKKTLNIKLKICIYAFYINDHGIRLKTKKKLLNWFKID